MALRFNPVARYCVKFHRGYTEIACDERVLDRRQLTERNAYGWALLDAAKTVTKNGGFFQTANYFADKTFIKKRMERIMDPIKRPKSVLCLLAILIAATFSCLNLSPGPRKLSGLQVDPVLTKKVIADRPWIPEGSSVLTNGRLVDNIDLDFIDDTEAIGYWLVVGFIDDPEAFGPDNPPSGVLPLQGNFQLLKLCY